MKQRFKLDNLEPYRIASELSDYVWKIVSQWEWFAKRTLGIQFVRAIDSVAGNIAEGFGRFHKKDKVKFYHNSRASVFESAHWAKRAFKRKLITNEQNKHILIRLRKLPKEINTIIKMTMERLKK